MIPVVSALDFPQVDLSGDDMLPADIVMLLVYRGLPENIAGALARGLRVFPHLTGRVEGWPPRIVPDPAGEVGMETAECGERLEAGDFHGLPLAEMLARFAPVGRAGGLFAVRRVDFPHTGVSALCLRASHMAVDGTGLGLLLAHATAAARGVAAPPVVHDRAAMRVTRGLPDAVPPGYVESPMAEARLDAMAAADPLWFAVPMKLAGNRNAFAAGLCAEAARIDPRIRRVAVWCNTRGRGGPPPTYTGNAGCYLHFNIGKDEAALAREIDGLASRAGLARARRMHQDVLGFWAAGREVRWNGPHDDLLQLNLLSPSAAVADFGGGRPEFALLLSRNASGLRVFPSVCGTRFVVEATLAPGVAHALAMACAERGMRPEIWGGQTA